MSASPSAGLGGLSTSRMSSRSEGLLPTRSLGCLLPGFTVPDSRINGKFGKGRGGERGLASSHLCLSPGLTSVLAQHRVEVRRVRQLTCRWDDGGIAAGADEYELTKKVAKRLSKRPTRIILVRHGESLGNVDEAAYTRIPDSRIPLTEKGKNQAMEIGQRIRKVIEADGNPNFKVYFYASPYLRSLQTTYGIGSAFERQHIAGVREEPRIREQDFGNFQDHEVMKIEKEIRLRYGRFFFRFSEGESASDVYDRVTGFRETIRADMDRGRFQKPEFEGCNMNIIIVSHGLTLRVFLMRWYKWTVQQYERMYNPNNCEFLVMGKGPHGRYSLAAHHTMEDFKRWNFSEEMISDQYWQLNASPGDLNPKWPTSGSCFFDNFAETFHNDMPAEPIYIDNAEHLGALQQFGHHH